LSVAGLPAVSVSEMFGIDQVLVFSVRIVQLKRSPAICIVSVGTEERPFLSAASFFWPIHLADFEY
jgi:hypothetical protein